MPSNYECIEYFNICKIFNIFQKCFPDKDFKKKKSDSSINIIITEPKNITSDSDWENIVV